jgi:hypothetical protein
MRVVPQPVVAAPEPCPAPAHAVHTIVAPAPRPQPVAAAPRRDTGLDDKLAELQARLSGLQATNGHTNGNGHHVTESPVKESHGAA